MNKTILGHNLYVDGDVSFNSNLVVKESIIAAEYVTLSDHRLKQDVKPLSDYVFTIDNLRPVCYYNAFTHNSDIGFIAHEFQEELPILVRGEKDGSKMQSINYTGLIGILVHELQQLKNKVIPTLTTTIKTLEDRIHILETNR
jgi:hypothetical protein